MAVDSISFKAEPGRVMGLMGPNAAGKTTLIKLISGMVKPTEGSIFLNGQDCLKNNVSPKEIGVLTADSGLPSQAPVLYYLRETARLLDTKQKMLTETIDNLGLAPILKQRFNKLSLGSRRQSDAGIGNYGTAKNFDIR